MDDQRLNPAEQEDFFKKISHAQQRRMDDQRCALTISPSPKSTPKHEPTEKPLTKDSEAFFNLLANSQGHRLDDQRVSLPTLPGIQNGGTKSTAEDRDQRCSLQPSRSTPATPTHNGSALNNIPTGQNNTQDKEVNYMFACICFMPPE
uniref:Uncharacterized protein n=1 Tax=Sphaeramia orbicularis TaxID=375764 RepID=A0A673B2W5_9TELE